MIWKMIAFVVIGSLVVLCYSLCAIASEADEQLERWEHERDNRENDE